MPLFLISKEDDGKWIEANAKSGRHLLDTIYENYRASASSFYNIPIKRVSGDNSFYVGQRECAVIPKSHAEDGFEIIGSDDATTCHIMIFRHESSGTVAVSHFDGADTPEQLKMFLKLIVDVLQDTNAIKSSDTDPLSFDAYIVGGFNDSRFTSEKISEELLWLLQTQPSLVVPAGLGSINVYLKLACISVINTVTDPRSQSKSVEPTPAICGAAISIKTGDVFPCIFEDHGPEGPLRSARHFSDESNLLNIFDHKTKRFTIKPFVFYPIIRAERILELPDEWILQNMSTSPKVEPPHFVQCIRDMIKFMLANPDWRDVFSKGIIKYEKRAGEGWVKL